MSSNPTKSNISAAESMDTGRAQTEPHNPTILTRGNTSNSPTSTTSTKHIPETISSHSKTEMSSNGDNNSVNNVTIEELSSTVAIISLEQEQEPTGATNNVAGHATDGLEKKFENNSESTANSDNPGSDIKQESPRPVIVVSPCTVDTKPSLPQDIQTPPNLVDDPDPRLVDALNNVRDRPFILKLEQQVISFIGESTLDSFDTVSINSYYRMLVHKIAEFYRLTHIVSPIASDSVRMFRGNAARIPVIRLSDIANSKAPREVSPNNQQAVKIMRRRSPSDKGDGFDQFGNPKGDSQGLDSSRALTREEKEAAYQLARARIFGDFKESPPDTPIPAKTPNEKPVVQRKAKDQDDGFQSRSQFFQIPPQYPSYDGTINRFSAVPIATPGYFGPTHNQHTPSLNPAANTFNPNAGAFIPGRQPLPTTSAYPQYPNGLPTTNGYPPHQQTQYGQYQQPQGAYNRPLPLQNPHPMGPPPMVRPLGPTSGLNSPQVRYPTMGPGIVPHMNSHNHPYQPHPANTYPMPNHQPFYGYGNGGMNGSMNGSMNGPMPGNISGPPSGNWPVHSPGSMQHGASPQADGSAGGYPGPTGGYAPGRG
ncbi:hypothetical protein DFH27DRAFT_597613 [Peziza echinospora]|nr:hypothetical protein DFH27DRAFT_597613 [Peziza echinospora]